jgi:hypothetical protein
VQNQERGFADWADAQAEDLQQEQHLMRHRAEDQWKALDDMHERRFAEREERKAWVKDRQKSMIFRGHAEKRDATGETLNVREDSKNRAQRDDGAAVEGAEDDRHGSDLDEHGDEAEAQDEGYLLDDYEELQEDEVGDEGAAEIAGAAGDGGEEAPGGPEANSGAEQLVDDWQGEGRLSASLSLE